MRRMLIVLGALWLAGCGPRSGTIEGRLETRGKGTAAAVIEVYLRGEKDKSSTPFLSVAADGQGAFKLTLPLGRYWLTAKADGQEGVRLVGDYPGNPVDLGKQAAVREVVISLEPADIAREYRGPADSGIEGMVAQNGNPVPGSFVYVYEKDEGGLMGPGYLTARPTDPGGRFRVNLAPGR
jgi:hypothetical protein